MPNETAESTTQKLDDRALELFNSFGRVEGVFTPLDSMSNKVGMYSCGPTVYSQQHVGNMRAYVFADTLKRALIWHGYDVDHVINITDVGHLVADSDTGDDKVEIAALKERKTVWELTKYYTDLYWNDLRSLNVIWPRVWTKATDFVPQMIEFCAELERRGFTYVLESGLYFDTSKQDDYGALAGLDREGLMEGARVEIVDGKKNATDFALWRSFTDGVERLMQWDSPWGVGSPGWHIECSVMSISTLGRHFDIHTGGVDHRTLHHINEIAQSEAWLNDGQAWVPWWLHNEYLILRDSKMSKSLGRIVALGDLVEIGLHPLAYRWFLLGTHYRSQVEFSTEKVAEANVSLRRLVERFAAMNPIAPQVPITTRDGLSQYLKSISSGEYKFLWPLYDDLDRAISSDLATPEIVSMVAQVSRDFPSTSPEAVGTFLSAIAAVTGVDFMSLKPGDFEQAVSADLDLAHVSSLAHERDAAREAKDWARADVLRGELEVLGLEVRDTPQGTKWVVKR